jgi:hypothetical protein
MVLFAPSQVMADPDPSFVRQVERYQASLATSPSLTSSSYEFTSTSTSTCASASGSGAAGSGVVGSGLAGSDRGGNSGDGDGGDVNGVGVAEEEEEGESLVGAVKLYLLAYGESAEEQRYLTVS